MESTSRFSLCTVPFLALFLASATGCGAEEGTIVVNGPVTPSKPAVVFPSRTELAQLPSETPRVEAFGTNDIAADTWTLDDPPAPTIPYDDPSPVGDLLREIQQPHAATVTLSPPLRCASREVGRFFLKNHGLPADSLRRFIVARCGGEAPVVFPIAWSVSAPASMPDREIVAHGKADLLKLLGNRLEQGEHEIGMAMVRDAHGAAIVAISAQKGATLEPGPRAVDANRKITLRGAVRRNFGAVVAYANQGDFGFSRCEANARVELPKFELTCQLAEGDTWAWIEVVGQRQGQVLQEPVADVLMYEHDGAAVTYNARNFGAPAPVRTGSEFTSALFDRLNGVRQKAKLGLLTLAPKQSVENARLAGTIFDASLRGDGVTIDRAAIGLLAGWNVEGGMIREGHFFLGAVAPTRDVTGWLDAALERPIGRITLLDPAARQVAIGPAIPGDAPALGGAVTTYALFDSNEHGAEERQFFKALATARAARDLPAPERVGGVAEMQQEAARVLLGGKEPMAALRDLIHVAVKRTGSAVRGYVFETTDPTRVEFPKELLRPGPLDVLVTITHHRAPDAAWGQYVIFVLVVDDAKTVTAQAEIPLSKEQS